MLDTSARAQGAAVSSALLGVRPELLETHGAVSGACAEAMLQGLFDRDGAELGAAVTGTAGPDGGTPDKPVGTVWFAWSQAGRSEAKLLRFEGNRDSVRRQSVACALQGLIDRLEP